MSEGFDPGLFAEKYHLALEQAERDNPQGGLCGFELEWNLLDSQLRPLLTVGSGPEKQSFVDYLRAACLNPWTRDFSQLEVFHWMIEWATRPYYTPRAAVYEARLMEASLLNALDRAGREFGEQLYHWPGNLLYQTAIDHDSLPGAWGLAKRRYLERCVDLYGESLATAGTHTNLSLPDPLLEWDFMHLSSIERGDSHLDEYKSEFYITATRLLRAFTALFIATSAATPFQARRQAGRPVVYLTPSDSVRNLTFPNPAGLDQPNLYRSYKDYLRISYDLVRRGVRFGNNNWTPARARSFAEPVERLIHITSGKLSELYARGLYSLDEESPAGEMAQQIEIQNLLARINLPMARVEVRTDDGGHSLAIDLANLTLKHLLLLRFYGDLDFGRAFRYDREDIARARRSEEAAARDGLRAEIEHPMTGKPVAMRQFLKWTLDELRPLAEALSLWDDLSPLQAMAEGAPNTAEKMRQETLEQIGVRLAGQEVEIPNELLIQMAEQRARQVMADVETIAGDLPAEPADHERLSEYLQHGREDAHANPQAPIRFRPGPEQIAAINYSDPASEILALAQALIRIPSVTVGGEERLDEVRRAATLIYDTARNYGLEARYFDQARFPALLIAPPGQMLAPVMLSGHFDVVAPDPDDSQFEPRISGDYLWGRGAADMKTVVATYLVWLKDSLHSGRPYPPVNLLLIGNEENGETEATGTPHALRQLAGEHPEYAPRLVIAGERTGERGGELWGEICTQNRGVLRFEVTATGKRAHSAASSGGSDLTERLLLARSDITGILSSHLTLTSPDGWQSQARFPYIQVGIPGVFNITADRGVLGVEVRPIPQDRLQPLLLELQAYCASQALVLEIPVCDDGIACDPENAPRLVIAGERTG
ncbi:MAG TPA: M20/M25/M40 family metallo-hydrolase, partial [Anaerolineales bacterium]|nr:M20/M25/M40 family metallo-hydrolase [Anaerolineales bacterium]